MPADGHLGGAELICISFCQFCVGYVSLCYLLCAEAKLITRTSTVADTAAPIQLTKTAHSVKSMLTYA